MEYDEEIKRLTISKLQMENELLQDKLAFVKRKKQISTVESKIGVFTAALFMVLGGFWLIVFFLMNDISSPDFKENGFFTPLYISMLSFLCSGISELVVQFSQIIMKKY